MDTNEPTPRSDEWRPRARTADLAVTREGDELLVYDRRNGRAHTLSSDAAALWERADGTRTVAELSAVLEQAGIDAAVVEPLAEVAIDDLCELDLIDAPPAARRMSRRELLGKVGVGAAAFAAIPVAGAITTPAAAAGVDVRTVLERLLGLLGLRPHPTKSPTTKPTTKPTSKPTQTPTQKPTGPETPNPSTPAP